MRTIHSLLLAVCLATVVNAHAVIDTFPYYNDIATAADVADWTFSGTYFSSSYSGCLIFYSSSDYCILPELDGDYMSIKGTVNSGSDFQVYATTADGQTDVLIGYLTTNFLNIPYKTKFLKIKNARTNTNVYCRDITINNSKLNPNTQWMVGDDIVATYETGGTLTLSGTGAMYEYNSASYYPYFNKFSYQTIIIEEGITSIGKYAFYEVTSGNSKVLKNIQLPQSLISIGDFAFYNNPNLKDIFLPDNLKSIGKNAFHGCSGPTSLYIPDATETIGSYAFYKMENLDYVLVGKGLKSIGDYAFYDCDKLKTLRYTATDCQTFGSEEYPVFAQCGWLQTVIFSENVETIPPYMFAGLVSQFNLYHQQGQQVAGYEDRGDIAIPPTIKKIGKGAFMGVSMDILSIPSSVESIGGEAFRDCDGLDEIYCDNATPPTLEGNLVFHNVNKGVCLLVVPSGAYTNYAQTNQWRDFVFIVDLSYFSASLRRMSINSQDLDEFASDKYVYSYIVPYEVERVSVNAEAESARSTVTGTGIFDLNVGLNVFVISVTAPDGITSNYYSIAITRQDSKSGIDDIQASNKLRFNSLVTDGYLKLFNFDESQPVEIFNSSGSKLISTSESDKMINVSSYPNGLYIIKNGNEVGKFIIQQ
ncbi:hypothetical protein MASR2M117_13770 [Paludibacter sp.]